MKLPKILSAVAAAAILLTAGAVVTAAPNFMEGVDWAKKIITVTGEGVVPPNTINRTQAKGLASKAATADAYRKIAEVVNGVRVEGEITVEKMTTTQDKIKMRVDATITGAKIINETFLNDGGYRVTMQVPLFGVSNSLAGAVFEKNSTVEPFPDPVFEIAPSVQNYNSSTPLQRRLEIASQTRVAEEKFTPPTSYRSPLSRLSVPTLDTLNLQNLQSNALTVQEPIYPASNPQNPYRMQKKSVKEYASFAQGDYTGLVVDCRGLGLEPVMSPVIKNSNGTKIYGHKNLDYDRIIREGMAAYVDDPENADRAGSNPLVVKAQALENFNSNPVVAIPDSNRILIENYATHFLKDLKVVFLFD